MDAAAAAAACLPCFLLLHLHLCILLTSASSTPPPSLHLLHLLLPPSLPSSQNDYCTDMAPPPAELLAATTRLRLQHIHSHCSPFHMTNLSLYDLTHSFLHQDSLRVRLLKSKLTNRGLSDPDFNILHAMDEEAPARVPVIFRRPTNGNYFITVGLGTPAQKLLLMLDTGSEVSWTQCSPCAHTDACYPQPDPIFDPTFSSSYEHLPCGSPLCNQLEFSNSLLGCSYAQKCLYTVDYADKSVTKGDFATETLRIGDKIVENFPFGCGHDNEGLFKGMDGLLALGRGPLALPNQTVSIFKGRFAYCLPFFLVKGSTGFIEFGVEISELAFTPLVIDEDEPSFYTVQVQEISLGDLPISTTSPSAHHVVIDSGTTITHLALSIYETVRDAFELATSYLPRKPSPTVFDTCYDLSNMESIEIPTLSFRLENKLNFTVPAKNMIAPVDKDGTYCFAFLPSHHDVTILGNYQQQGFRFLFDIPAGKLAIEPDACF